jgi:hypothetical protein
MLQQPDKITILYWHDHQVRHVRMNQSHPAAVVPSWLGDSVGHYEGDTLVIDTVGIKIGPFSMVDMYGTPYTEALHVVERYRLLDYESAKNAQERGGIEGFRPQEPMPLKAGQRTPTIGARDCSWNSRSRMTASSRCPGRRPKLISVSSANGRNMSAPKIRAPATSETTPRSRVRTSRISERRHACDRSCSM